MKSYKIILMLRIAVAVILIQTLRFKFTAHPDSVYIFETVGLEPYGRIGVGILELVAGILLLIPKTVWAGALLTLGLIGGAIVMHLTQLGIEVNGDGGVLFYTAMITFLLSAVILYYFRKDIPVVGKKLSF
ncbi:DoxX family membrane protein [Winogradskyella algicola]|uniref:DoxX family membrane protein n=1 Tax=Winogradskyella algicola TaxID=2575815 RepID=UPI001109F8A4|nr:DoxX family membrane protein [Winogradskyella algicola]